MKTLTGIFTVNAKIDSFIEINKNFRGYHEYLIVHKSQIIMDNGHIQISEKVFNSHKDFFLTIRSI
jgi:hypothetical protein